ncbi:MAG: hypothetical protein WA810_01250 [Maribacter sp.]
MELKWPFEPKETIKADEFNSVINHPEPTVKSQVPVLEIKVATTNNRKNLFL